ncbi:hypothetical protein KKJ09_16490 [Xenorhabdus bovienii]|uniref:hypothetical protein n=1 Tax=Xenorhabdus bovienii TaxID=40576 RepID=UPI0023B35042|nr:hypothetical protein [Xenorhabdus bovienii]MDE9495138.1 hypothetical protein [Xenorhabdus bovienii]MDE9503531.1 hypothetical protein [Xenorhabdus bovienii]MDE9527254.1 hypothetical protein [Xenorhabdus bovienii]
MTNIPKLIIVVFLIISFVIIVGFDSEVAHFIEKFAERLIQKIDMAQKESLGVLSKVYFG